MESVRACVRGQVKSSKEERKGGKNDEMDGGWVHVLERVQLVEKEGRNLKGI